MKKALLILALFVTYAGVSQEITFTTTTHDFGQIKEGDKVSHDFVFTNTGKSTLILSDVLIACDCTTSEWPKEAIAPGKEGKIKVMYDSKDKDGAQKKVLMVKSNATNGMQRIMFTLDVLNENPVE